MPRQLLLSRVPVDLSIVEFNLDDGEDIFLTYTWERAEGPGIKRTGEDSPYMVLIGGEPGQVTTHPFGLRLGTWLIQEEMRKDEREEAEKELRKAQGNNAPAEDIWVLRRTIDELNSESIRAHDQVFGGFYPYEVIGQQGCGDVTMNTWSVGFINSELAENPPALVCLPQEPLDDRSYSCLVKWKASECGVGRCTIEEVQFRLRGGVIEPNQMARVRFGEKWLPRGDSIEFAVSNQQVIRDGKIVAAVSSCHQFGDLRHLIQMPNLNPPGQLYPGEPAAADGRYRPRKYFGEARYGDIWLGEKAFLDDEARNLLRAALAGPIRLEFPAGADRDRLRGALQTAGYHEVLSPLAPVSPGGWRFVPRGPTVAQIEICFKRNAYGWTMIGLTPDNRRILCLACTGMPGRTGYTLERAAETLLRAGAWNALLIDEGADVFQRVRWNDGTLTDMVPRFRNRLRATFVFARLH